MKFLPLICCLVLANTLLAAPPRPPEQLAAADHPWDSGQQIDLVFGLSPDDAPDADPETAIRYSIKRSEEFGGLYDEVAVVLAVPRDYKTGKIAYTVGGCERQQPYFFRVRAVGPEGETSPFVETKEPVAATRQWFDGGRKWFLAVTAIICGSVVLFIQMARRGMPLHIRKIAGLEAVDEAVGRATEMGRSVLFIPGVQDMKDIQTVAGLTILSRVAQTAAEYGAKVEVPTCRSLVMTGARETVESAYLTAGRPDAFNEDSVYYVTDEQFGYVAYLSGLIVRDRPAACFYMGAFFAESLILAETGHSVGAIQVAGTAMPSQLPFFVAACDYTLIGEEFFAASAYLSGDPDQLGSLKGQDVGKLIVGAGLALGCALATVWSATHLEWAHVVVTYLTETVLN